MLKTYLFICMHTHNLLHPPPPPPPMKILDQPLVICGSGALFLYLQGVFWMLQPDFPQLRLLKQQFPKEVPDVLHPRFQVQRPKHGLQAVGHSVSKVIRSTEVRAVGVQHVLVQL